MKNIIKLAISAVLALSLANSTSSVALAGPNNVQPLEIRHVCC